MAALTYNDAFAVGQALGGHPWWYARHHMEDQLRAERATAQDAAGMDATAVASTDIITTATEHGLRQGREEIAFAGLVGGAPLEVRTIYYARDVTPTTFRVAATRGGAPVDITSDMTAGLVLRLDARARLTP